MNLLQLLFVLLQLLPFSSDSLLRLFLVPPPLGLHLPVDLLLTPLPALLLLQGVSLLRPVWADGEPDDSLSLAGQVLLHLSLLLRAGRPEPPQHPVLQVPLFSDQHLCRLLLQNLSSWPG